MTYPPARLFKYLNSKGYSYTVTLFADMLEINIICDNEGDVDIFYTYIIHLMSKKIRHPYFLRHVCDGEKDMILISNPTVPSFWLDVVKHHRLRWYDLGLITYDEYMKSKDMYDAIRIHMVPNC
jgi:hypothetical protein